MSTTSINQQEFRAAYRATHQTEDDYTQRGQADAKWMQLMIKHNVVNKPANKWPQAFHDDARQQTNQWQQSANEKQEDYTKHPKQSDMTNEEEMLQIEKIGKDCHICYGDGGDNDMTWPIYVCHKFEQHLDDSIVSVLKQKLIELGAQNDDWREGEPIQNIIDPDLYVYKFYDKKPWLDEYKEQFDKDMTTPWDMDEYRQQDNAERWKKLQENDEKGFFIRRRYSWLATEFRQSDKNEICILSPIHNIQPRELYADIYIGIEHVFHKMLPLFNKFPAFQNRKYEEFQVIVKSQRYEIDAMSGYAGHWHQEGLTENIKFVGLYYYEKTAGLHGGNMRFRNLRQPSQTYAEYVEQPIVHEADIEEGTAVVFDNTKLVHRVRMLKNKEKDKQKRYRSFLAFFIVDPEKPIISTRTLPSLKKEAFMKAIVQSTVIKAEAVALLICEFASCGYTLKEAQEVRKLNIEVRKKPVTKGQWVSYHFGNCGEQLWFNEGKANPNVHGWSVDAVDEMHWMESTTSALTST